jgi:hypothetical protein
VHRSRICILHECDFVDAPFMVREVVRATFDGDLEETESVGQGGVAERWFRCSSSPSRVNMLTLVGTGTLSNDRNYDVPWLFAVRC